jgi:hypothetical protein
MTMPEDLMTIRPNPRAVFRALADEAGGVVLHLDTAAYHSVNAFGAHVWSLLGDGSTFEALLDRIRETVDEVPPTLREEVGGFLSDLRDRDLVRFGGGEDDG